MPLVPEDWRLQSTIPELAPDTLQRVNSTNLQTLEDIRQKIIDNLYVNLFDLNKGNSALNFHVTLLKLCVGEYVPRTSCPFRLESFSPGLPIVFPPALLCLLLNYPPSYLSQT